MINNVITLENGRVEITFVACPHCKVHHKLNVRQDELEDYYANGDARKAFPNLLDAQIELFLSGIGGECWKEIFAGGEY